MRPFLLCVVLAVASTGIGAQDGISTPPIPRQERFVARTGLKATFRVSPNVMVAGHDLTMWVMLENTGTTRLRVPGEVGVLVTKLVSTATGREIRIGGPCYIENTRRFSTLVRSLRVLAPGQKLEMNLPFPWCGYGSPALPIGSYEVHAAYRNYAFSRFYDVYERGANEIWEGTLTMPPAILIMFPSSIGSDAHAETSRFANDTTTSAPFTRVPPSLHVQARPEASHLNDYLNALLSEDSEAAATVLRAITRFGHKQMYAPLRAALTDNQERGDRIGRALAVLTFTDDYGGDGDFTSPAHWDAWWKRRGGQTREQWALQALTPKETRGQAASRAADYLVTSGRGNETIVSELSQHRLWEVRLAVADALASFDQRHAAELMLRELDNRYVDACTSASTRLSQLTRTASAFDCEDTAARQQGIVHWRTEIGRLPRTP